MNRSAHEQAVKLSVQSSSAFGDMHLTNVCGECGRVQGDWTMDIDIHQRVVTSHTTLEIWPKSVRVRGLYLALSEIAEIADAWKAIRSEGTVGS